MIVAFVIIIGIALIVLYLYAEEKDRQEAEAEEFRRYFKQREDSGKEERKEP